MAGDFRYGAAGRTDTEVAVVRAIYDAFAARDIEAALPHISDEFELLPTGTAQRMGRTVAYRGPAGVREYVADVSRVWAELTLHADDIRAVADSVVVFGHITGIDRDGVDVRRRVLWTWKLRDGKAVSLGVNDFG